LTRRIRSRVARVGAVAPVDMAPPSEEGEIPPPAGWPSADGF
jgi:hypothetical protein